MIGRLWIAGLLVALAAVLGAGQDVSSPLDDMTDEEIDDTVIHIVPSTAPAPASEPATEPEDEEPLDANQPLTQPFGATRPASGPAASRPAVRAGPSERSSGFDLRSRFGRDRSDRSRSSGGPAAPVAPAGLTGTSLEDYAILTTRNIFVKDRRVREPIGGGFEFPRPPTPREDFILTGIALLDSIQEHASQRAAFFEDTGAGRLVRVLAGEVLDGGRIESVSLDGVVYEKGGVRRRISIGGGLSGGGRLDLSTRPAVSAQDPNAPGGGDAEERMRRRRQEQMR